MARALLVDGYNVIHAHPDLGPLADSDLELARARLVELVAEYARSRDIDATVVFDGAGGSASHRSSERILGVSVVFSARGESADAVLESLAFGAPDPGRVTVATSDRATQEAVFSRGVLRMSARELVGELHLEPQDAPQAVPRWRATVADRLDRDVIERLRGIR